MNQKSTVVYLVIHCTATPEGREVTGEDIRRWHTMPVSRGGRGWKQVGYTDLIHLDGTIERLVPNNEDEWIDPWEITNGVKGINSISRHIVYAGGLDRNGKPKDTRTAAQQEAMRRYVLDFMQCFPGVEVKGHNDFANKDCPCFDVSGWLEQLNIEK
ncbi:MAG: N-acetylmuramoyl-L-alanine amidase [Bacteroidales bacterium]|nr:N-acetylmuramoyl-L-alanine amidase [Bacteroidales bacterium]